MRAGAAVSLSLSTPPPPLVLRRGLHQNVSTAAPSKPAACTKRLLPSYSKRASRRRPGAPPAGARVSQGTGRGRKERAPRTAAQPRDEFFPRRTALLKGRGAPGAERTRPPFFSAAFSAPALWSSPRPRAWTASDCLQKEASGLGADFCPLRSGRQEPTARGRAPAARPTSRSLAPRHRNREQKLKPGLEKRPRSSRGTGAFTHFLDGKSNRERVSAAGPQESAADAVQAALPGTRTSARRAAAYGRGLPPVP